MNYKAVTEQPRIHGFCFDRQARGSHEIWYNPTTHRRTTVPRHSGDLPRGTLRAIIRQTGLSVESFLKRA